MSKTCCDDVLYKFGRVILGKSFEVTDESINKSADERVADSYCGVCIIVDQTVIDLLKKINEEQKKDIKDLKKRKKDKLQNEKDIAEEELQELELVERKNQRLRYQTRLLNIHKEEVDTSKHIIELKNEHE